MSAGKHTPGPWVWLAATSPEHYDGIAQSGTFATVAHIAGLAPRGEHDANARLIAAAPELLALLQRGICMTGSTGSDANLQWFSDARAAVLKATGSAQ